MGVVSRLTATAPPGGRGRTSNPGWPRGPPPVGASRRDLPIGCARRSPERSPGDGGSIPPTSTIDPLSEQRRDAKSVSVRWRCRTGSWSVRRGSQLVEAVAHQALELRGILGSMGSRYPRSVLPEEAHDIEGRPEQRL